MSNPDIPIDKPEEPAAPASDEFVPGASPPPETEEQPGQPPVADVEEPAPEQPPMADVEEPAPERIPSYASNPPIEAPPSPVPSVGYVAPVPEEFSPPRSIESPDDDDRFMKDYGDDDFREEESKKPSKWKSYLKIGLVIVAVALVLIACIVAVVLTIGTLDDQEEATTETTGPQFKVRKLTVGESTTLDCPTESSKSLCVWEDPNGFPIAGDDDRYEVKKCHLLIKEANAYTAGQYKCFSKGKPTHFLLEARDKDALTEGASLQLSCLQSEPMKACFWKTPSGQFLNFEEDDYQYQLLGDPRHGDCTLWIQSLKTQDSGIFTCYGNSTGQVIEKHLVTVGVKD